MPAKTKASSAIPVTAYATEWAAKPARKIMNSLMNRPKGGKPIITLPATAKNGTVSRIVPRLQPGAGVVTSRGDVHYVITEHGVACLHGKTLRQRAEALIRIAAPRFQDDLERFAIEAKILCADRAFV